jgi:(p)ppGpp synthase/HD superfamily hydrolase
MDDLFLARALACKFHAGQMYGKEPYTYHLDAVKDKAVEEADGRLAVIALLHDILEDTSCSADTLLDLFGNDITDAVIAMTKGYRQEDKDHDETYLEYIARCKANPLARKVKMYDSAANMEESMLRGDMKRVLKYSKQIQLLAE